MRVTFVIISVSDRVAELNHLLDTIRADARWDTYDINILFQDPEGVAPHIRVGPGPVNLRPCGTYEWRGQNAAGRCERLFVVPEKLGCHGARVQLLRNIEWVARLKGSEPYDAYINLDDDMELGPQTNYGPVVEKTQEPGVGFIITAWARTPGLLAKKTPDHVFSKQIMMYNGGGMAYSEGVARLMRQLPIVKTAFDCAWPITAYVNGYQNLYYYGSLTVHRVCAKGGMQAFMRDTPLHVMCGEWLNFTPAKRQDGSCLSVLIPLDKDVKPEAKALHRENRMKKWGLKP